MSEGKAPEVARVDSGDAPAEIPTFGGKVWYIAVVKPLAQYREMAKKALRARGYAVFLPMCREIVIQSGQQEIVERPMYGRYLFVGVDPGGDSWAIRWVPGIQHMTLDARRRPVTIAVSVLSAIADRMGRDGGVINLVPPPKAVGSGFIPGQLVRITDGTLTGWEGLFQADQGARCRVLLTVAGPESALTIPATSLEAVQPVDGRKR
ncbi:transcription termination/antitermination NusG family protein [Azospirillum picis]|uniref:Transcriptional antiterminator RfaH n=1 Tax=Azospirillum picis TaxID=488438 RepID=A0ABU0MSN7_9PROT|nr:transcription termination/antitermination NusG family protein [Azospirillum picis]MBP2302539.1 transcriptional antiterminator RfaH [Azospirillum picis]MDQ0536219.1 transcriptional antiterminator RfaH [Azospirillum picis]